jgi:hypothetical protein
MSSAPFVDSVLAFWGGAGDKKPSTEDAENAEDTAEAEIQFAVL